MNRIFSSSMVIQRNRRIKIKGMAPKFSRITLQFDQKTYQVVTNDGSFSILLPEMEAGGPYTMKITIWKYHEKARNIGTKIEEMIFSDILVGDVFLLSGQSNMEMELAEMYEYEKEEIDFFDCDAIRQFKVPVSYQFNGPKEELEVGSWIKAVGNGSKGIGEKGNFSAVGFFFAKKIWQEQKIPIGLIQTAVSGAPIEAFLKGEDLTQNLEYRNVIWDYADQKKIDAQIKIEQKRKQDWYQKLNAKDPYFSMSWQEGLKDWQQGEMCQLPGMIEKIKKCGSDEVLLLSSKEEPFRGSIWLYKEFELTQKEIKKDPMKMQTTLKLGLIEEEDEVYINGKRVGSSEHCYVKRSYSIPEGLLRYGVNHCLVRITSKSGRFRYVFEQQYGIELEDFFYSLEGNWKVREGFLDMEELQPDTVWQYKPSGVYNAMIAPLEGIQISGILWYQGESNSGSSEGYRFLQEKLLLEFRRIFQDDKLPFWYVQLAGYEDPYSEPEKRIFACLREEQERLLKSSLRNIRMVSAIDLGERHNLHPEKKKDLGLRLASCALNDVYKEKTDLKSLQIIKMETKDKFVLLTFSGDICDKKGIPYVITHLESTKSGFEIAGEDEVFYPAKADITGDKILLSTTQIEQPTKIRYLFDNYPDAEFLYQKSKIPLLPFRDNVVAFSCKES